MNKNTINQILSQLTRLDLDTLTKVQYDKVNDSIVLLQRGKVNNLYPLRGLIKVKSKIAILAPDDLQELISNLQFLNRYDDDLLFVPIDLGYKVYGRDLQLYKGPKIITELRFYSVKNRFYLKMMSVFNRAVKIALKL